jgi:hypothetical protein
MAFATRPSAAVHEVFGSVRSCLRPRLIAFQAVQGLSVCLSVCLSEVSLTIVMPHALSCQPCVFDPSVHWSGPERTPVCQSVCLSVWCT